MAPDIGRTAATLRVEKLLTKLSRYPELHLTYYDGKIELHNLKYLETLRPSRPEVLWYQMLWIKGFIPQVSFFSWITIQDRLSTKVYAR